MGKNYLRDNLDLKHLIKDPKSPFLGLVEWFKDVEVISGDINLLTKMIKEFGTEDQQARLEHWIQEYNKQFDCGDKNYPVLSYMSRQYSSFPIHLRADYINMVDELNNLKQLQRENEK